MKKVLTILMAITILSSILGCSPATSAEEGEVKNGEPVTLVFHALTWIKAEQEAQQALIDEWNAEHPDIQVELILKDWGTMSQELLTSFETGDVPDIFHYSQPVISDWKDLGYLADLSPMITEEDRADVNDDIWAGLTADDGSIVGVPIQYEVDVTYYNKDIFEKYEITPPTMDDPWTFDELITYARQLQGSEFEGFMGMTFPGIDHFGRVFPEVWAPKIGDDLVYKNDEGKYYLKLSDESVDFIGKVKGLIDEGLIGENMLVWSQDVLPEFLNGNSAMLVGYGCWYRSMFINESEGMDVVDWGVAAPLKVNQTDIYGYIQTLSVPAASKHKEEAFEFLKWYWKPENVLAVAKAAYIMPGRNSAINDPSLNTPEYSWDLTQQAVQHNVLPDYVQLPGWGQFSEGVATTLFGQLWAGELTLDEFVTRYESEGTKLLQEFNE